MSREKVLFVVHVENMFRDWFGPTFEAKLCKEVYAGDYDRVIILNSEIDNGEGTTIESLRHPDFEVWHWSWGYEGPWDIEDPTAKDLEEHAYNAYGGGLMVQDGAGHEWTWTPPEILDHLDYWQESDVRIAGGCDNECLQDWRAVLESVDIPYSETGITY